MPTRDELKSRAARYRRMMSMTSNRTLKDALEAEADRLDRQAQTEAEQGPCEVQDRKEIDRG
ncbi:MAG: hypothetical protein J0H67_04975 [Rhodospirillales bacterium]|nr:hypothetical protein [Rhodospirillales bacterium]